MTTPRLWRVHTEGEKSHNCTDSYHKKFVDSIYRWALNEAQWPFNQPRSAPLSDSSNLCHSHHPLRNLQIPHSQKKTSPLTFSRNLKLYKLPSHALSCVYNHPYFQSERVWYPFTYTRPTPLVLPLDPSPPSPASAEKPSLLSSNLFLSRGTLSPFSL